MGSNLTRTSSQRKSKKYILCFHEGTNTEPIYIEKLKPFKKDIDILASPLKKGGITYDCLSWFKTCVRAYNCMSNNTTALIDTIWFVFDDDGRNNVDKVINSIVYNKLNKKPLCLAYSSICIEYWILLHFRNHNGSKIYQNTDSSYSKRLIKMIDSEIDKCNKYRKNQIPSYSKSNEWLEDNFKFFLENNEDNPLRFLEPKPRIVEAFVKAKKIHEAKIASGNEFEESVTTFYKLLEYLGVVYYKDVIQDPEDHQIYDVINGCYTKNGKKITIQDTNLIKNEPYLNR